MKLHDLLLILNFLFISIILFLCKQSLKMIIFNNKKPLNIIKSEIKKDLMIHKKNSISKKSIVLKSNIIKKDKIDIKDKKTNSLINLKKSWIMLEILRKPIILNSKNHTTIKMKI